MSVDSEQLLQSIKMHAEEELLPPPTEEELLLYAEGALTGEERDRIARYLDRAPWDAEMVACWAAPEMASPAPVFQALAAWLGQRGVTPSALLGALAAGVDRRISSVRALFADPGTVGAASGREGRVLVILRRQADYRVLHAHRIGAVTWNADDRELRVTLKLDDGELLDALGDSQPTFLATLLRGERALAEGTAAFRFNSYPFVFSIPAGGDDDWLAQQQEDEGAEIVLHLSRTA